MQKTVHDLLSFTCSCSPTLGNNPLLRWGIQFQLWLCPQILEDQEVPLGPFFQSRCCHVRGFFPNHSSLSPGPGQVVTACQRFSLTAGYHGWPVANS